MIEGPVLVELLPGGRVRSPSAAKEHVDGHIPKTLPYLLGEAGSGVMLYAQRKADVHLERPDGKRIGKLHPGALVSAVPKKQPFALIGLSDFTRGGKPPGCLRRH